MARSESTSALELDPVHIEELERALSRVSYLLTRVRRHDRAMFQCGLTMDRASVPLLRQLAEAGEPMRLGELAARLDVEAPHVTRQIQRLEKAGYVERIPDPDDRRAQLVLPTEAARRAVDAIREVYRGWMREALAEWTPEDLRMLAVLSHRMIDDFFDHAGTLGDTDMPERHKPQRDS